MSQRSDYLVGEIERLKAHPTDDCVEWPFGRVGKGYGAVYWNGKPNTVHRMAWELAIGKAPDLDVLHTCDNPACFNPKHLYLGTDVDNARDRSDRNRTGKSKGRNGHVAVNYNLPEPLIDWVAEYARRTTRTKSGVIRVAVEGLAIRAGADMLDLVGDDRQSEPVPQ